MARQQRRRGRAGGFIRLCFVLSLSAFVLNTLHNLLAAHVRKQRELARALGDRLESTSGPPLGTSRRWSPRGRDAPEAGSTPRGLTGGPLHDRRPSRSTSSEERETESATPTPIRVQDEGTVSVPSGWATRERRGQGRRFDEVVGCATTGAATDSGGRTVNAIPPLYLGSPEECAAAETVRGLCTALASLFPSRASDSGGGENRERGVLLVFCPSDSSGQQCDPGKVARAAADDVGARAILAVAPDAAQAEACAAAAVPYIRPSCGRRETCRRPHFAAAAAIAALGADVLLVSHGVHLKGPNPLINLPPRRGADVEGITVRSGHYGQVVGMHDPAMGWSAYSQSMAVPHVLSSLVLIRGTREAQRLAAWLGGKAPPGKVGSVLGLAEGKEGYVNDDVALTDELLMPAHDGHQRSGATFRELPSRCFGNSRAGTTVADASSALELRGGAVRGGLFSLRNRAAGEDPNDILKSQTFDQVHDLVLRDGAIGDGGSNGNCGVVPPEDRIGPAPRPLRWVVPPQAPWPAEEHCNGGDLSSLCEVVSRVAVKRQVLVAVSNSNILYMLGLFLDGVKAANISNTIVVALDQRTADWCKRRGAPYYHRELKSLTGSTDNHATSGLKFEVLREFLTVGASVLLSDVDVVWMRNPFGGSREVTSGSGYIHTDRPAIYGDSDVEGMTDGWDDLSAFGFEYTGSGGMPMRRLAARNSGLFYLSATFEALHMVTRLAERMRTERNTWDQTAYNEEQVWMWSSDRGAGPSGGPVPAGVSQRVMSYACFQNTKYLFRYMRYDPQLYDGPKGRSLRPVSVHVNYHPEKPQRMVTIIEQYIHGERDAIAKWHWGEGMTFAKPCVARPNAGDEALMQGSHVAKQVLARIAAMRSSGIQHGKWAGIEGFMPREDGTLKTPWGEGRWGVIPPGETDGKDRLYFDFINTKHMAEDDGTGGPGELHITSTRCNDGEKVPIIL